MNITVIGAGNGGQAMAAFAAMKGHNVCLFNRCLTKLVNLPYNKRINLHGAIEGSGLLTSITDNIGFAVQFADVILVTTTATAHRELAQQIYPYLREGQILLLNPGRTGGVLEFKNVLNNYAGVPHVYLAETQTLVYACRLISSGEVNIIGVKDRVLLSGINSQETQYVISVLSDLYTCFIPARNILHTSLENIGAIFHPSVILFNSAAIERGENFYFYRDMTDRIAQFITQLDNERLNVGKAFGLDLITAADWVTYAYPNIKGKDLCERMKNNPAYYDIVSPSSIYSRQLLEDVPTGLLPISELGRLANVDVSLMRSIIKISTALLGTDFYSEGRTLERLGLANMKLEEVIQKIGSNED